jgi:UDP-N-acetylmuramate dehydrogenase
MHIDKNISLRPFNTFGIDAKAKQFARFTTMQELEQIIAEEKKQKKLILGGGSNILFTRDVDALVLKNEIKEIKKTGEDADFIYLTAGAGENWHSFVLYCVEKNFAGIENLSLIPGCVGASPMQNIGAYGVEIKDVFHQLTAYHLHDETTQQFNLTDCEFGYRESVFKRKYKEQFVILDVTFKLRKKPQFHTSYGAIEQELEKMGIQDLSIKSISDAVINIRSSKLPDPNQIGNAGSFFKNPSISKSLFEKLRQQFESIVGYPNADDSVKLAAGWLIEQCGLKGYRNGDAGVHAKQALVLVNYGNANGNDIYQLSETIVQSVNQKFGVTLEREVNII